METNRRPTGSWACVIVLLALIAPARAEPSSVRNDKAIGLPAATETLLAQAEPPPEPAKEMADRGDTGVVESQKAALPIRFGLGYYLYSDYVWRGKNLSEYRGEGREMPNHQMTTTISYVTECFGTIGFDTFWEFYAAQEKLNPLGGGGQNLQEVDFATWWSYFIEPLSTNLKLAYVYDIFPNKAALLRMDRLRGNDNDDRTQYYNIELTHNDAWMWKWLLPENTEGVLNPKFLFSQDFGALVGEWMEFGFSHTFKVPCIENLTITPGWKLLADCNYWSRGLKLAGDQWALVTAYDLTPVLHLPKWAGRLVVTGELYFNNAFGSMERNDVLHDEFWGGTSVRWNWGG